MGDDFTKARIAAGMAFKELDKATGGTQQTKKAGEIQIKCIGNMCTIVRNDTETMSSRHSDFGKDIEKNLNAIKRTGSFMLATELLIELSRYLDSHVQEDEHEDCKKEVNLARVKIVSAVASIKTNGPNFQKTDDLVGWLGGKKDEAEIKEKVERELGLRWSEIERLVNAAIKGIASESLKVSMLNTLAFYEFQRNTLMLLNNFGYEKKERERLLKAIADFAEGAYWQLKASKAYSQEEKTTEKMKKDIAEKSSYSRLLSDLKSSSAQFRRICDEEGRQESQQVGKIASSAFAFMQQFLENTKDTGSPKYLGDSKGPGVGKPPSFGPLQKNDLAIAVIGAVQEAKTVRGGGISFFETLGMPVPKKESKLD
ncbi:hypothetical protein FJZ26_01475 [Candidatus Parvarchaeota archaeon]|nr:hypothetical protein [Candidatus Parvarchaeota archaeon]